MAVLLVECPPPEGPPWVLRERLVSCRHSCAAVSGARVGVHRLTTILYNRREFTILLFNKRKIDWGGNALGIQAQKQH